MDKVHEIGGLSFEYDRLQVRIDGKDHVFDLKEISSRLLDASAEQRAAYEVSPSGYGIHWPLVDEDLSIDGLLGVVHSRPPQVRETQREALTDR